MTVPALPIAETLRQHMALTREHKDLMRQVAELRDANKAAQAQRLMKRTEVVYAEIKAIEERTRVHGPGD